VVDLIKHMFPNGIGMKGTLAFVIISAGAWRLEPDKLFELALMAATAYFLVKAMNGKK